MRRASTFVYHGLVNSQVPNQAKLESRKKFFAYAEQCQ